MTHFLDKMLNPTSIAFLGASNNIVTMGTGQCYALKSRFRGKIYPIHPSEELILGLPVYRKLEDLPEIPDLLIIVLPTRLVMEYVEAAGKLGIPYVIIVSAGFSEIGDVQSQEKLNEIATLYNLRFLGPNCIGVINTHCIHGILNCTWFPFELPLEQTGNISLLSQSGSWISQILIWAERRGIRISKSISVGNEANISMTECLDYFHQDKQTKVIGMYIEGIKREGRQFIDALHTTAKDKPIIVSYHGGTTAGARAGLSHTASLGGKSSVYRALFKQSGVIQAANMEELFEFAHAFSLAHTPQGNRIGLVTNSGGPAVTLADLCEKEGLQVVSFSEDLQAQLRDIIPAVASANNPIDLTFDMNFSLFYEDVPKLIWHSGEVDALIFYGIFGSSMLERSVRFSNGEFQDLFPLEAMNFLVQETLDRFFKWVHTNKIPVLISCIDTADKLIPILQNNNIPVFKWPGMTTKAMSALVRYYSR
ncbi:MAG: acetate--CoA ligase family protein [Candidatus Hodarchaeales archaeon]|jgi:acetyltransferase